MHYFGKLSFNFYFYFINEAFSIIFYVVFKAYYFVFLSLVVKDHFVLVRVFLYINKDVKIDIVYFTKLLSFNLAYIY